MNKETEYGWYLCLDGEKIVTGPGVIENDFHNRKYLAMKDTVGSFCAWYRERVKRRYQECIFIDNSSLAMHLRTLVCSVKRNMYFPLLIRYRRGASTM